MATMKRLECGTAYITLTHDELCAYNGLSESVCDFCIHPLSDFPEITLVPILNQALCPKCWDKYKRTARRWPEDEPIEVRREEYYKRVFNIKEA